MTDTTTTKEDLKTRFNEIDAEIEQLNNKIVELRLEKAMARSHCVDCARDTCPRDQPSEFYMVRDELWAAAGMAPRDGYLCVECLERRLGRQLNYTDFYNRPCNNPNKVCSPRLRDRLLAEPCPEPTDVSNALRGNALKILAWTEAWGQIADWDSSAAKAIRDYLAVPLGYHSRVLNQPARYLAAGNEANGRAFEALSVVEATLPPEKISAVDRRVRDLEERLRSGDSTGTTTSPTAMEESSDGTAH